jgi:hypothetical protein
MFLGQTAWAMLPVDFTSMSTLNNLAVGQVQVLNYTIRNNVKTQSLPIKITIVNDGDTQSNNTVTQTNTCGNSLGALASCSITVTVNGLQRGSLNRHLNIDYRGRAPLTSPLVLNNIEIANTTILVYIVGSNLESDGGAATNNIQQMEQIGSTANMNVVIETGGADKPGWLTVKRQFVQKGSVIVLSDLGSINMANTSTIQDFVTWGINNFPAKKYLLVFWDHGGGPNGGFGGDENFNNASTPINQLIAAVQGALSSTGATLELIGFDTCLLGSAEFAAGLSSLSHYFVGSEDLEPGLGWQYNTFLNYVNSNPNATGLDIGKVIVDGFTAQNAGDTTTQSVLDLSQMPNLVNSINEFSTALSPYVNSNIANWKKVAQSRYKTADYYTSVWTNKSTDVADLIGFLGNIQNTFSSDTNLFNASEAVIIAAQNVVKYFKNSSNRGASLGITTYFPSIMASYQTNYGSNVSLNNIPFYSANYINLVDNYNTFYQNNIAALTAIFSNFTFSSPNYTATLSNDYSELYAGVGSSSCNIKINNTTVINLPCLSTIEFSGITSTSGSGSTWNISYDKSANQSQWPLINGTPALLIDSDVNLQVLSEQSYMLPATQIAANPNNNTSGFLQLINNNGNYTVVGFLPSSSTTTSANPVSKIISIENGTQFYLQAYAQSNANNQCFTGSSSGTWCLLNTNIVITAPFTITFGALPVSSLYNQFAFLAGDLTGALQMTSSTLPY